MVLMVFVLKQFCWEQNLDVTYLRNSLHIVFQQKTETEKKTQKTIDPI